MSPRQREATRIIAEGRFRPCLVREDDGWHARWRGESSDPALDGWIDEYVREAAMTRLTEDAEEDHYETLHDAWLTALRSRTGLVVWDDAECAAFAAELESWSGNAAEDREARAKVRFALEADAAGGGFRIACDVPRGRAGLKALGQAVWVFGPLRGLRLLPGGRRMSVDLTRGEAEAFVRSGSRDLRNAGYPVDGVDLQAEVSASAEVDGVDDVVADGGAAAWRSAKFRLVVRIAGEQVTADEVRFLLDQGSTLVYFRDRWIEVDRGILREALRALERGVGKKASPIAFALGLGHVGRLEIERVAAHGWVRGLVNELRKKDDGRAKKRERLVVPGFVGELREYQEEGVEWIRFMTEHGFGALLADDMGLGKTVQTIAWIMSEKSGKVEKWKSGKVKDSSSSPLFNFSTSPLSHSSTSPHFLIVAPLTLLSNWVHEFSRFAPGLKVYVHQGAARRLEGGFARAVAEADVTLTNYSLLVREYSAFSSVAWDALVLDEAQAIKNPDTQVAKAVRALSPARRLALTGTPVENAVSDLWSLEAFLNPGFLGDRASFEERFARPVAVDPHGRAAKRLKSALEPFVMRRLKTDPGVAAELGEKREVREYCSLLPAERRAYEDALAQFRLGVRTKGDALALLTRLKLVCDGDGSEESGKAMRLFELVDEILAAGESALVFTQYAKVGARLQAALEKRLERRVPFLHGGVEASRRDAMVRAFQSSRRPGVFVLSLKAGGFGLNLTKATHVIHYDRWWNPAVESQATDRAHRIGQSKTVFVHLFVTSGTVEERVDEILAQKETLRELIADGAAFWRAVSLSRT